MKNVMGKGTFNDHDFEAYEDGGKYYYEFTKDGNTVLKSAALDSAEACQSGLQAVMNNANEAKRYAVSKSKDGSFTFNLTDEKGNILGSGTSYKSQETLTTAIAMLAGRKGASIVGNGKNTSTTSTSSGLRSGRSSSGSSSGGSGGGSDRDLLKKGSFNQVMFTLFQNKADSKYYYEFTDAGGSAIINSTGFGSKQKAQDSLDQVLMAGALPGNYDVQSSGGKYSFNLKSTEGKTLANSASFASEGALKKMITAFAGGEVERSTKTSIKKTVTGAGAAIVGGGIINKVTGGDKNKTQDLSVEARKAEELRLAEARKAEELRLAEHRKAEELRMAEEKRLFDEKAKAEKARIEAEKLKIEEKAKAEEKRLAAEKAKLEEQRKADELRIKQEKAKADELRITEEKRVAAEKLKLEEKRKAEQAKLEAEQKRKAEELRIKQEKRLAEEKRLKEELRLKEIERKKAAASSSSSSSSSSVSSSSSSTAKGATNLGSTKTAVSNTASTARTAATATQEVATKSGGGWWKWLLPLLLLIPLFFVLRGCDGCGGAGAGKIGAVADNAKNAAAVAAEKTKDAAALAAEKAKAEAAAVAEKAKEVLKPLGPNASEMKLAAGTLPAGMADFLSDPNSKGPKTFTMETIDWPKDSPKMNQKARTQISSIAAVMKKYPNSTISINGYRQGNEIVDYNHKGEVIGLDDIRARCLYRKLNEQGISKSRMKFDGNGVNRDRNRLEVIVNK